MTNYGKTRYVRVSDIIFETVDERKLNNSDLTLRQFYEQKYGKKINHAKQPLLEIEENRRKKDNVSLCLFRKTKRRSSFLSFA